MSSEETSPDPFVLHVRPTAKSWGGLSADRLDERLTALEVPVQSCSDVYRALARLCKGDQPPLAVIVLVDVLQNSELEFFTIAARKLRGLPVHVYGSSGSALLEQALKAGASCEISDSILQALAHQSASARGVVSARDEALLKASPSNLEIDESEPTVAEQSKVAEDIEHAFEPLEEHEGGFEEPHEPDLETDDESESEPESEEDSTPTQPARVPWLRYSGGPTRTAPARMPPEVPKKNGSPMSVPQPVRPLLTPEELEALLNDEMPKVEGDETTPPSAWGPDAGVPRL